MSQFRSAFFAFPSEPAELKNPIVAAVEIVKSNPFVSVEAWPQLPIFGAAISDEVKDGIERANVLVCDITRPNQNVYYEAGYSIGFGKSLAPVLNASFANATADIQKDGLFDIVGYKPYENSQGLVEILGDLPSAVLVNMYSKPLNPHQPIYFLNAYHKTNFISSIAAAIKDSKVFYRSFDPAENPRFTVIQTISEVTASAGVVIPFLEPYVADSDRHNIRAAFLAGLAHGLGRDALLIRHHMTDAVPAAADFRDEMISVRSEPEITEKVIAFCKQTLVAAQSIKNPSDSASESVLQRLSLGATAAENEFRTLEDYFVVTSEYLRTSRGEARIVAGRKGSGKTAIFFMVGVISESSEITSWWTCGRNPISSACSKMSTKILDLGAFDHTIAAFWYFVILSEILFALKKELEFQAAHRSHLYAEVHEINSALDHLEISASGDFTARINRLASYVGQEIKARREKKEHLSPEKLTNIVFRSGIAEAKRLVVKHSSKVEEIIFLFDNIDKGWAADGVDELDVRLVRLLLESLEKVKSDLSVEHREFMFVVFLRNDVFELMVSNTPDKGKAAVVRIDWTDRVKLKQVIYRRLQAPVVGKEDFHVLWNRFFVEKVNGRDAFEYMVDHCLMRPRFLISIVEMAIANAINRGHQRVLAEDCINAVRPNSILNDFGYEIRDVSGASEMVLHSLVGATEYITKDEVLERFEKAKIIQAKDREKLFDYMLWYGVLGVVNDKNVECYIYDFEYNMNRLRAEIFTQKDEPLYAFNRALHVALKAKGP